MTLVSQRVKMLLREQWVIDRIVEMCINHLDRKWGDGGRKVLQARNRMQVQFRELCRCLNGGP